MRTFDLILLEFLANKGQTYINRKMISCGYTSFSNARYFVRIKKQPLGIVMCCDVCLTNNYLNVISSMTQIKVVIAHSEPLNCQVSN